MSDRSIASRPSLQQVIAIVDFMEQHPTLALGQMRGLEGREESKKLWLELTRIVNSISGPTRPMKSWIKYWADKKSMVRSKVQSGGGDSSNLCSNIEKKIWDLFLADDQGKQCARNRNVKQESQFTDDSFYNEDCVEVEINNIDSKQEMTFEDPIVNFEKRQINVMDRLVKVMSDQATALSQLAHASLINSQAMEKLAESSQLQARAIDRIAATFDNMAASSRDVRGAVADIDDTLKRYYPPV